MSAYLSTTFWGTPTNLLASASTSSEGGIGGALTLGLATAATIALCVAARALARSASRRRERRREAERARKRRDREARAAFCADFLKNNGNSVVYATACDADERVDVRERTERRERCERDRRNNRDNGKDRKVRDERNNRNERRGRWERDGKTRATAERRRRAKARRAALRSSAFWTLVAASVGGLASLPTPNVPKNDDRSGETPVANRAEKAEKNEKTTFANRVWDAPNVEIREVADAEGSRWANAVEIQDAENKRIETTGKAEREKTNGENNASAEVGENKRNGENSEKSKNSEGGEIGEKETTEKSTFAADAVDFETRAIVACRAVSESVDETPRVRWVQTASGELTRVEQIRAESSVEIAPDASANAAFSENGAWPRRPLKRSAAQNGQVAQSAQSAQYWAAAQSGQVSQAAQSGAAPQFAQPAQNLAATQNGAVPQFAQPTRPAQNLAAAQNRQVSQAAQSGAIPQPAQPTRPAQNLAAAQSGQIAQTTQPAQRWEEASARDAVVTSAYNERRNLPSGNALAQEFAPIRPLIPFPSEERDAPIASVGYRSRVAGGPTTLLEQIDAENQRIGARVQKAVLSIETLKRTKTKSTKNSVETGCGFLFQYNDKVYLATNMHVVKDATSNKSVKIFLPDQTTIHPTRIMTCADFDLAALELDPATLPKDGSVALCFFGNSDDLRVSNFVGTVGNPFGLRDTVTSGHVSSLQRRKNDFTSEGEQSLLEFIQIDASINPGNSGGPLYNARGEVVGVVAAIATTTGKSEGVAFAIPINLALSVLKSTIDAGGWRRSHMGVELEAASRADFQSVVDWPIKSGSKIVNVNANSPAERAGLRRGDVVVEFDGEAIEDDVHFARLIAIADVSKAANVKFLRGARLLETSARLERSGAK